MTEAACQQEREHGVAYSPLVGGCVCAGTEKWRVVCDTLALRAKDAALSKAAFGMNGPTDSEPPPIGRIGGKSPNLRALGRQQ